MFRVALQMGAALLTEFRFLRKKACLERRAEKRIQFAAKQVAKCCITVRTKSARKLRAKHKRQAPLQKESHDMTTDSRLLRRICSMQTAQTSAASKTPSNSRIA